VNERGQGDWSDVVHVFPDGTVKVEGTGSPIKEEGPTDAEIIESLESEVSRLEMELTAALTLVEENTAATRSEDEEAIRNLEAQKQEKSRLVIQAAEVMKEQEYKIEALRADGEALRLKNARLEELLGDREVEIRRLEELELQGNKAVVSESERVRMKIEIRREIERENAAANAAAKAKAEEAAAAAKSRADQEAIDEGVRRRAEEKARRLERIKEEEAEARRQAAVAEKRRLDRESRAEEEAKERAEREAEREARRKEASRKAADEAEKAKAEERDMAKREAEREEARRKRKKGEPDMDALERRMGKVLSPQ